MQDAWWLIDHKTKRMVEETLGLSGVLTFTVREGQPLHLTREQVATLSVDDFLQLWQVRHDSAIWHFSIVRCAGSCMFSRCASCCKPDRGCRGT